MGRSQKLDCNETNLILFEIISFWAIQNLKKQKYNFYLYVRKLRMKWFIYLAMILGKCEKFQRREQSPIAISGFAKIIYRREKAFPQIETFRASVQEPIIQEEQTLMQMLSVLHDCL